MRWIWGSQEQLETLSVFLAVTTLTVFPTNYVLNTGIFDNLSVFRYMNLSTFSDTKQNAWLFLAMRLKGVTVSSQEFPEGLLADVHFHYLHNFKSSGVKLLSNQDHAAFLVLIRISPLLITARVRRFQCFLL